MRNVIAVELVSLDGVMESPEEWAFSYSNDEMEEANASGMAASDALLMGRVTYEQMVAYWPNQPGGVPMVDYINSVSKYVVSTTLEEPLEWNNSTLIKGDVAEEIARLKRQPGRTSRSSAAALLCVRCFEATSSTNSGLWFIPWSSAAGSVSSRTVTVGKRWSSSTRRRSARASSILPTSHHRAEASSVESVRRVCELSVARERF